MSDWMTASVVGRRHSISPKELERWRRLGAGKKGEGKIKSPMVEGYHYDWLGEGESLRYNRVRLEYWLCESQEEHGDRIERWKLGQGGQWLKVAEAARLHSVLPRVLSEWRRRGEEFGESIGGRCPMVEGYHYYWIRRAASGKGLELRYHKDRLEWWLAESPQDHVQRLNAWAKAQEVAA